MDIHSTRTLLRTKTIYDLELRVTFYARVSTESDEQLNSLENQITYYKNLISQNSNWEYVEGYIDEGISAITTKNRENFHRMVDDAKSGKFDFIITKEITRFARNTLDSISYTRDLLSYGVGVFFQNDNINTLDEDSELRLTIMSGIAQDELRKLSSRIKFGHKQAIQNGVVLGSRIFGYDKRDRRLYINEEEAVMVRTVFELYSTGEYSLKKISDILWEQGYRNTRGNKIQHNTLSNMVTNPKYKGYYVGNKVKIVDMFTKKQKFLPPEEWVMFKDETGEIVPAIVSEELWDSANEVFKRRSADVKARQGKYTHSNLLTGKLICTHCGAPYYRKDSVDKKGNRNSIWRCSVKLNNGAASCPSISIYESEIKKVLFEVLNETSTDTDAMLEEYTKLFQEMSQDKTISKQISKKQKELEMEEKKKSKLLDYNVSGKISDDDFIEMNTACLSEIKRLKDELIELNDRETSSSDFKKRISDIRRVLEKAKVEATQEVISNEFVDKYIDKIFVTPNEDEMKLEIKIFTGKSIEKYMGKLRSRSGHMVKKMIQAYENGIQ